MADAEIQALVQQMAGRLRERRVSIAVVGDMILDHAIEGLPAGRHPDIGVPILKETNTQESIGGAGNIALALARLGVDVALFGVIGSDLPGRQLENLLDRQPFADYLVVERGWPTPRKDWIYARQDGKLSLIQRIDYNRPLSGSAREELVGEFRTRCPSQVDVVIFADHGLGSIGAESVQLLTLARERRAKVVTIPRTTALRGQAVDAIAINAPEMKAFYPDEPSVDAATLAARYARQYSQHVFLTLLGEGILICPAGSEASGTLVKCYPIECCHWMGARDMATAAIALGMALDFNVIELGRLANAFRSLVAGQWGNGRVLWRDILQFVGVPTS